MADLSVQRDMRRAPAREFSSRSDIDVLRILTVGAGLTCSILFVVLALRFWLQEYADGSMFSYAVAVRDAWAFHWHNISGRVFVFLFSSWPAEIYVALTGDPTGGIVLYGLLFYVVQLIGLGLTFGLDRSKGRIVFVYACASTAGLCPLVFGFPTEMWMAHALFWPALACAHDTPRGAFGLAALFALLLALILTHGGAVLLALAILATLALRGWTDPALRRGAAALLVALVVWSLVHLALPPDAYFGGIIMAAALNFIDVFGLVDAVTLLLAAALAGYALLYLVLRRRTGWAAVYAALPVLVALALYWLRFDHSLLTDRRYDMRTALLIGTPVLGALATSFALRAQGKLRLRVPLLPALLAVLARPEAARLAAGALLLVLTIHVVETAKFVTAWSGYRAAVRGLAMGTASDAWLGDARFVSSARISPDLNRLSWFSTTPYLSVLVAPGFAPKRLVVDPADAYFWLSCATARANESAVRTVPRESRALIRLYSCEHRMG